MIDSHCHLTDPRLFSQLDDVLARARAAGVTRIITIGTGPSDNRAAIELCRNHSNIHCAIGIHPNYCHEISFDALGDLRELQYDPSVLALGEMGLDYHYEFADRARQGEFFEAQLALAIDIGRPVVIHCRDAVDDCLAILHGFAPVPAVFHCFTGTPDEARRILDAGYVLGFTGAITFKKSDELRQAVRNTPKDRLLVETDAPYLSPEPMRKVKANEPAFVVHTAAVVAEQWGIDVAEVDRITTENVERFFRLSPSPSGRGSG
jgi:TatD DNase family protein